MSSLRQKVIQGIIWRMLEQFGAQLITFVVSIVLARILGPEEFGTVALLTIFISLSQCLVNSGFGVALIQKKDADDLDFNSVFYFSLAISVVLYGVLWLGAPIIATFYGKPILTVVLRVAAMKLFLDGINGVQNAVLAREMLFKLSFRITLSGTIASGIVGIWMAYAGYGLWALVWSSLISGFVAMGIRWFLIGWRPGLEFSWQRLKGLFHFGSKMLASGLLDTFFNQIYGLLIGKLYSPSDLAYFNRGENLPQMVMNSIQGSIGSVVFPALSKMQDDPGKIKMAMRKVLQMSSFFVFPMMFGLAAVAKPIVLLLLTEKWLPAVPYMQLACISYAFWPMHVANLQAVQALGRSDIFLKLEIIKKIAIVLVLAATFRDGVLAMAIGRMALAPFSVWVNSLPNKRLVGYSQFQQIQDIGPGGFLALGMALAVWALSVLEIGPWVLLFSQLFVGLSVYIIGAIVLGLEPALAICHHLKKRIQNE